MGQTKDVTRVGGVGTGRIFQHAHLRVYPKFLDRARLVGLYDVDPARAQQARAKYVALLKEYTAAHPEAGPTRSVGMAVQANLAELRCDESLDALTALSEWIQGRRNTMGDNQYEEWPAYDVSDPLNWFAILNDGLRRNPPYGPDAAIVGLFESIGIGADKAFDATSLAPATARGLRRAVEVGRQIMACEAEQRLGMALNNWVMIPNSVDYTTPGGAFDFLFRTAVSLRAQPGQDSGENFFNFAYTDAGGEPLHGDNRYTIRFERGALPPVDAFWSITMYDHPAGFLVENPLDRYQIGTYDEMQVGPDGSLTLYFQADSPGVDQAGNWLPAPKGPFYLCLRLYNARSEALTFDWLPPPVQKVK